jgi:hypothetical protein
MIRRFSPLLDRLLLPLSVVLWVGCVVVWCLGWHA